jgi:hypothetical protein
MAIVPKSNILVLNQEIDDEKGFYRVQAGRRIHYLVIFAGVFDDTTMYRPYLLVPCLPELPDYEWTTMEISYREGGFVETKISSEPLPAIDKNAIWHTNKIEVLDIKRKEYI